MVTFDPVRRAADREEPPYRQVLDAGVAWCADLGVVLVARHDLVRQVLADPATFGAPPSQINCPMMIGWLIDEMLRARAPHRGPRRVTTRPATPCPPASVHVITFRLQPRHTGVPVKPPAATRREGPIVQLDIATYQRVLGDELRRLRTQRGWTRRDLNRRLPGGLTVTGTPWA